MGDFTRDSTPLVNDLAFRQVCNRFRDDEFHRRRESFMFYIRTEELMKAIGHVYSVELLCFIIVSFSRLVYIVLADLIGMD